jgi:isopenicillin-N epimerase
MPSALAAHWTLDPAVRFLNHGSFGAAPRAVLDEQTRWRARIEREPVAFLGREIGARLDEARDALAEFLRASSADLVFVPNATTGVNSVLRSLELGSGDELLTTSHAYNACRNALEFAAQARGASVRVAPLPFPIDGPGVVLERVLAAVTPRTKLCLIDHVTSPTGLVLPVAELAKDLRARGVLSLVDGAHAPGMLDLDVPAVGADFYTGNLHKWVCAPKGAAFLWARPEHQAWLRPTVISHGANAPAGERSRFHLEFDWPGTDDPSAYLSVPAALHTLGELLPGGWPALRAHNRALACAARALLCEQLDLAAPAPEAMLGSLATLILSDVPSPPTTSPFEVPPLQRALFERHGIEIPVWRFGAPPVTLIRLSAQAYNDIEDYRALGDALARELDLARA